METTKKKIRVSKAVRAHLEFLAQSLELIAQCTPEKWQEICAHTKDESIRSIAQSLRHMAARE